MMDKNKEWQVNIWTLTHYFTLNTDNYILEVCINKKVSYETSMKKKKRKKKRKAGWFCLIN